MRARAQKLTSSVSSNGPAVVEWERFLQHMTQRGGRVHVVGDPLEAQLDLVVGALQRRPQDVVLGPEVVGERAGRVPGLDRDLADGDVVDADARDHPPGRFDQLLPSALVINDLWQLAPPLPQFDGVPPLDTTS